MTIGEAAILAIGSIALVVNLAAFRDARRMDRWVRRVGGVRAARIARSPVRRSALRILASLGAVLVGGLASLTPGRFSGTGWGLGVGIVAGIAGFCAVLAASVLDYWDRYDVRRGVIRELMAEQGERVAGTSPS